MSSRKTSLLGYGAGAVAGVSYGFNPLFAKHLLENQVPIYSMLFFRYAIAALCMGIWMVLAKESLKITTKQLPILIMLHQVRAVGRLCRKSIVSAVKTG